MRRMLTAELFSMLAALVACSSTSTEGTAGSPATGGTGNTGGANVGGASTSGGSGGSGGFGGSGGDYAGTWALKLVTTTVTDVGLGPMEAPNTTIIRAVQSQAGSAVTIVATTCDFQIGEGTEAISVIVPDAFIAALPEETITAEVTANSLHVPRFWELRSVDLVNPETDALPTEPTDPRVRD